MEEQFKNRVTLFLTASLAKAPIANATAGVNRKSMDSSKHHWAGVLTDGESNITVAAW
jgi:hypothetical protein